MAPGDCLSHPNLELLARLERIDALDRRGAPSAELLPELRGLLRDAERWSRSARGASSRGEEVVERRRTAPHGT
jgi:hypothetical protein